MTDHTCTTADPCCSCAYPTEWFSIDLMEPICGECEEAFHRWADANRGVLYRDWPGLRGEVAA